MRILKNNVLLRIVNSYIVDSPEPANISYLWNFGSLLGICLVIQILTGCFLAMHYTPHVDFAFNSVEHIMRDVNNGWIIRYLHANVASFFFIFVYSHVGRGLYYSSYKHPRVLLWSIGVIILILMMAKIDWPNCKYDFSNITYITTTMTMLPINKPRTKAILRIGPHNKEVLDIIICGMLSSLSPTLNYINKTKNKNFSTSNIVYGKRLSKLERENYNLSTDLQNSLIGLLLGDVSAVKRSINGNTYLYFEQGFIHKEYIFHLYNLFAKYCGAEPKISDRLPDKRTNNIYTRVVFVTYSLPCFNEIYNLFYSPTTGKKIVPLNICELLTPIGLAYWLCDDGSFNKRDKLITIATNSYTLQGINLLLDALIKNFNLNCKAIKQSTGYVINIYPKSIPYLQDLLEPIIPSMMKYKLGL